MKSTYALDVETVAALERMAERLKITKSEALRRAIRAATKDNETAPSRAVALLDQLQRSLKLTPNKARAWARETAIQRRASSERSEGRGR